jgi:BlaI family penicillinase repressor
MKKVKKNMPTDAELEILDILWEKKEATVREIYDAISIFKKCVYTSTLKTMQKMTAKKIIGRRIKNQIHTYYPLVEESKVRNNTVKELIDKFFKGSYSKLALHALGNSSKDEHIDELIELVNNLKHTKK